MNKIERDFVELLQSSATALGIEEDIATILAVLYIQPGEVTMDVLAEKCGYSVSSVCTKLRMIEKLGLIKRHKRAGKRKLYFSIDESFPFETFKKIIKTRLQLMELLEQRLPLIIKKYSHTKNKTEQVQLSKLKKYYKEIKRMRGLLTKVADILK